MVGHADEEITVVKGEGLIQFPRRGVAWHTEPVGKQQGRFQVEGGRGSALVVVSMEMDKASRLS